MSIEFDVESARLDGERGLVSVRGEVDIYTAPRFKESLLELLDSGVSRVVVDLSEVTFIDSTALGVLIGGVRRLHDRDGRLSLVVASRPVERVLTVTGLDRVFAIHPTRDAALAALD
mgnify:CR=1 FL=1